MRRWQQPSSPRCLPGPSWEAWIPTKHAVGKHGEFDARVPLRFARPQRHSSAALLTVGALKLDSNKLPLVTGG